MGDADRLGLFFDRDGTIIVDKHYMKNKDEVELFDGAQETFHALKKENCLLFLFTNQSGVARHLITMEDVIACNNRMIELLAAGNDPFDDICIAPEGPNDVPVYRKPSPKFILEMIEKYHLSADKCYMIGDKASDVLTGINAGIESILISSDDAIIQQVHETVGDIKTFASIKTFKDFLLCHVLR